MTTNIFPASFAQCLVVFAFKVSNDLNTYLLRHSIIEDCYVLAVLHMTKQILILSILIDFIQDCTSFIPFFGSFSNI